MNIKFEYSFEVDESKFTNLTKKEIREHFKGCAMSYMQQVEEEILNLLADENVSQ